MENTTDKAARLAELKKKYRKKSQLHDVWRRLRRNRGAVVGLVILTIIIIAAVTAPLFFDYDGVVTLVNTAGKLQKPCAEHIFGTDGLGRDVFARVVYGARYSLSIAFLVIAISFVIGGTIGATAGFYGGKVDNAIMRVMDVFSALPSLLLALCIVAALGPGDRNLIIAMTVSSIPSYARVMRGPVLMVRDADYIEAARAIGAKDHSIILSHIVPNCIAPVIVNITLGIANSILSIAGLSFLGLGVQAPAPEWGSMLAESRQFMRDAPFLTIFPGVAIMLTILSLNLLGDGLRDALDPRLK